MGTKTIIKKKKPRTRLSICGFFVFRLYKIGEVLDKRLENTIDESRVVMLYLYGVTYTSYRKEFWVDDLFSVVCSNCHHSIKKVKKFKF